MNGSLLDKNRQSKDIHRIRSNEELCDLFKHPDMVHEKKSLRLQNTLEYSENLFKGRVQDGQIRLRPISRPRVAQ